MQCEGPRCACGGGSCQAGDDERFVVGRFPPAVVKPSGIPSLPLADLDMSRRGQTTVLSSTTWPPAWWFATLLSGDSSVTAPDPCPICGRGEGEAEFYVEVNCEATEDEKQAEKEKRKKDKEEKREDTRRREEEVRRKVRGIKPSEGEGGSGGEGAGGGAGEGEGEGDSVVVPKDREKYESDLAAAKERALDDALENLTRGKCPDKRCPECDLFKIEFYIPPMQVRGGACIGLVVQRVICRILLKCKEQEQVVT